MITLAHVSRVACIHTDISFLHTHFLTLFTLDSLEASARIISGVSLISL